MNFKAGDRFKCLVDNPEHSSTKAGTICEVISIIDEEFNKKSGYVGWDFRYKYLKGKIDNGGDNWWAGRFNKIGYYYELIEGKDTNCSCNEYYDMLGLKRESCGK